MPLDASTNSIATSGADSNTYASSARDGICDLAKPRAGRATTSGISAFIACVGPSVTRSSPSGRGLHNAATRKTTGKPCAGNPHARFERGRCPLAGDKTSAKGQRLPMKSRAGLVGVAGILLWLGACGSSSPPKSTPPDDTGGEGGSVSTGGAGGTVMPKPDASPSPDLSAPESDTGTTDTGGSMGAEAGVPPPDAAASPDTGGGTGEFPLAAVKAGKATLLGKVNTQTE